MRFAVKQVSCTLLIFPSLGMSGEHHLGNTALDIIKVLLIHQLMHLRVVLKTIIKFTLKFYIKITPTCYGFTVTS